MVVNRREEPSTTRTRASSSHIQDIPLTTVSCLQIPIRKKERKKDTNSLHVHCCERYHILAYWNLGKAVDIRVVRESDSLPQILFCSALLCCTCCACCCSHLFWNLSYNCNKTHLPHCSHCARWEIQSVVCIDTHLQTRSIHITIALQVIVHSVYFFLTDIFSRDRSTMATSTLPGVRIWIFRVLRWELALLVTRENGTKPKAKQSP